MPSLSQRATTSCCTGDSRESDSLLRGSSSMSCASRVVAWLNTGTSCRTRPRSSSPRADTPCSERASRQTSQRWKYASSEGRCPMGNVVKKYSISYELAQKMVDAAVAKARELSVSENVAIVDDGGNLKAFGRMDGASMPTIEIAQK